MTTNKRTAILVFFLLLLAVIGISSFHGVSVEIDDGYTGGLGGFTGLIFGLGIAAVAILFALSLTGVILTGVAILLCVIVGITLGAVALALLPLLFPVLLLVGVIALFSRSK